MNHGDTCKAMVGYEAAIRNKVRKKEVLRCNQM